MVSSGGETVPCLELSKPVIGSFWTRYIRRKATYPTVDSFVQLNLASQSVLEGLNACFDHRAEVQR